jgi:heat shock protein HtpX
MFAIIYAFASMLAYSLFGVQNLTFYLALSFFFLFLQYMIGPKLVEWSMRIKYVEPREYPELHRMVDELAMKANIPKPRLGISQVQLPNAFAFGRWKKDGRVCVTEGILRLLSPDELKAVLGHEISHLKNRDVLTITLLSVIPLILYRIGWHLLYFRGGSRNRDSGYAALIGLAAFIFYFITNLLVLYASRIREYFADRGSINLGNSPQHMATALYKLVYGSARLPKESLREVEGLKAFFVNDPSRGLREIKDLKALDMDKSGTIDYDELLAIRTKTLKLSFADKMLEVLSTHPNMLKRIKQLSNF